MERADLDRIERAITHELTERFGVGTVQRAVVLQYGDEPEIGPGQLLVRVFIPAPGVPAEYEQALAEWEQARGRGWTCGASYRCGYPRPGCSSSPSTSLQRRGAQDQDAGRRFAGG